MKLKNPFTGFTVVEILVVMTMTTIIAVAGTISYNGVMKRDQLESYAKEVVSSLEKARNKAINQEGGVSWGVRFEADSNSALSNYAIFKGETAGTDFVDVKHLNTSINFTAPNPTGAMPIEEIVFNKKTGTIKDGNNHSIQIAINNSPVSKNIYITQNGLITLGLPPEIELLSAPVLSLPIDGSMIGLVTSQTVGWGGVTGAQTYRLEVSTDISFSPLFFYNDTITSTSYSVTNLQPYTVYYWRVRAYSASAGNGPWSNIRSFGTLTVPDAPQSPGGIPSSTVNALAWNAPANNGGSAITGYKIYWGTASGNLPNTISLGNVLTYNHTGLSNGTTYYYKIAAINAIGEGTKTSEFSSTPVSISLPTAGTLVLTPSTSSYIPGTLTSLSAPFTSSVAMTSCEYTLNGGTNWYAATLSGSVPNYTCTQSNITGFADGSSYTLNMRGTNGAGTTPATAATRTGDATGPTVTDNWTNNWTATTPVAVTLTPTDAKSGVATTKYCIDTSNTCLPSTGTTGTSVSVTCSAGTTCTQYVRYAAWDNVGNASSVYSETVRQDSQAPTNPTLTATPGSTTMNLSWTAATDSGSGLASYKLVYASGATAPADCNSGTVIYSGTATTYTHTGLTNGTTYSYRVCTIDALGNTSTGGTASAIAGNTLPTAGTLVLTPSTSSYIPGTLTSLSAPFTSSVAMTSCEYTLNGGTNWYAATLSGSVPNYTCTQSNITGFADGSSYTLNMRGTNGAGTTPATAATRTGDATGPTVTDNWTNNWTATTPVTVTLTPTDARSGVASTKYCVDTANTCSPSSGSTGTSVSVTCSAGTTCTQYVRYAAWDNVGNVSAVYSETVRQDIQAPTNPTLTATAGNTQISLSWTTATDSGAGLHSTTPYKVVFATGATAPADCNSGTVIYSGTATTYTHTGLTNGTTYSYRVCTLDNVSNMSTGGTGSATPTAGNPPTVGTLTLTPSTASYVPGTVTTLSAPVTSSIALTSCEYATTGTNWAAGTVSGSAPNFTCTKSGITSLTDGTAYSFNIRATNAGGTGTGTALSRTGDTNGPTVADNWTNDWTATTPVTVTLTPTDARSGVATTKYCVDTANTCSPSSGSTGTSVSVTCSAGTTCTQYVRYAAWDNVGNASSVYSKTVRQDLLAPTNGTITVTPGNYQNALSWTSFSDADSGLASTNTYKVVYLTTGNPAASCATGTQVYLGTATSYTHTSLAGGTTYYYRVCAYDAVGNISTGATNSGVPTTTTTTTTQPSTTWTLNAASGTSCSTVCTNLGKLCSGISTTSGGVGGYGNSSYEYYSTSCSVKTQGSCSTTMTNKGKACAGNTAYWTYCKCDNTPTCASLGGTCMANLTTCQNYPGCPLDASGCGGVCCMPNC